MAWRLLKNRLATKNNLERIGVNFNGNMNLCVFYNSRMKNAVHLFFECESAFYLWSSMYDWLGVKLITHNNPASHFLHHTDLLEGDDKAKFCTIIWIVIVWSMWNFKNEIIFQE
ncbi:hypothetical protein ACS0TY_025347 [Phlomoides rotata]